MSQYFFALWPDDLVRKQVSKVIAALPGKGYKVKAENLHTCLAVLGELSAKQLSLHIQSADQINTSPFTLKMDSREWWKRSQTTAIGASDVPDQLFDLINSLNQAIIPCGYDPEKQPFRLHITLMENVESPISPVHFEPISWLVRSFSLIESSNHPEQPSYRVIQSWDFV
ncbi:MAG: RNA 2',3'-cyclic phosphodiesterase [Gammaproteobacteria bacterium]